MDEQNIINYCLERKIENLKGTTIGLTGKLGAGKTYLVQKILETISAEFKNQTHSPTFNLCNVYNGHDLEVHHFDMYRVESEDDLYNTGVWESLENSETLVFIEWPDLFPELLNACDQVINIIFKSEEREYEIQRGKRAQS